MKKSSVKSKGRDGYWVMNFIDQGSGTRADDAASDSINPTSSEPLERHPEFFFDNTLVAIQVKRTLFNVHKYQLVKSEEGSSPENPIQLKGISALDFAALLRVPYASHFSSNPPAPEASLIIPAFRLANLFNFSQLCAFLLPLAEEKLDAVNKIVFAREFDIKQWLVPAHVHLCQRENPLTNEEAQKIGMGSVLMIWRMREQHRSQNWTSSHEAGSYYCDNCTGYTRQGWPQVCKECSESTAYSLCDRPARATASGSIATDATAIEAGVKKWVESGCTVTD
ncbi:unnamed protein product [Rhizoctonia solani]|uniref:BTB domain-containing protein n=1 Tax=Rhizoctonia solani TaxID=456999 RepID=A0A8H3E976_9AGAM|nr:unnamed protein product [Rhizoctonia solani]